jgi:hypothetical protein
MTDQDIGSEGDDVPSDHARAARDNIPIDCPSNYLRERCPLCFGGENWAKPDDM